MLGGKEFCLLASNFFAGILTDFKKIGQPSGKKIRRLGVLTMFKQGLCVGQKNFAPEFCVPPFLPNWKYISLWNTLWP